MSIKVSSWVWDNSEQKGTALLLMLAIADISNDDGAAWPGIARLARKTRTSGRNVKLLLHKLEDADELEVLRGVGRHHTNVYGVKAYRSELQRKGEDISPLEVYAFQKGEVQRKKGETQRKEKVKSVSPNTSLEPSDKPSLNSSSSEPEVSVENLPDDTTSKCLLLLSKVKGFPRDNAENALYLAELRTEFPTVDATQVVRQYQVWHRDNPGKTKNYRQRLRNFFQKAYADGANGKGDKKPTKQTSSQFRGGNEHTSVDEERKQRIRRQMGMAS